MTGPLREIRVSGYSWGEPTWYSAHHLGTDLAANDGTSLYAPASGTIEQAFFGTEGGNTLWLRDGEGRVHRFLHLSNFTVPKGASVLEGQEIGKCGHSGKMDGKAYAPHLHWDVSLGSVVLAWPGNFVDPMALLEKRDADAGDAPRGETASVKVPVEFAVRSTARVNWRSEPSTSAPVMATYDAGTEVACSGTVAGEAVDGNQGWYKSKTHGWYSTAAYNQHL